MRYSGKDIRRAIEIVRAIEGGDPTILWDRKKVVAQALADYIYAPDDAKSRASFLERALEGDPKRLRIFYLGEIHQVDEVCRAQYGTTYLADRFVVLMDKGTDRSASFETFGDHRILGMDGSFTTAAALKKELDSRTKALERPSNTTPKTSPSVSRPNQSA